MEPLITEGNFVLFYIIFDEGHTFGHSAKFEVCRVTLWDSDDQWEESEPYLEGSIRYDGGSNFWFGDSGYIHLRGKREFELHKQVMDRVWDMCSKKIKNFSPR